MHPWVSIDLSTGTLSLYTEDYSLDMGIETVAIEVWLNDYPYVSEIVYFDVYIS